MNLNDYIELNVTEKQGFIILEPQSKELTFKNSKQFLNKTKKAVTSSGVKAILTLENIEIIDSMSLGTLMALLKHIRKRGGDLVVTDLSEPIKELFKLLNFNSVFRCFSSVDEAIAKY